MKSSKQSYIISLGTEASVETILIFILEYHPVHSIYL